MGERFADWIYSRVGTNEPIDSIPTEIDHWQKGEVVQALPKKNF
jgi:hypothetical protein